MKSRVLVILAMSLTLPILAQAQLKPAVTKSQAEQVSLAAVKGGKI